MHGGGGGMCGRRNGDVHAGGHVVGAYVVKGDEMGGMHVRGCMVGACVVGGMCGRRDDHCSGRYTSYSVVDPAAR